MTSSNKPNESSDWPFERILRDFDAAGVRHLVIGGQAAVAYGVSQFTLDADLWVEPTARNLGRLRRGLTALKAKLRFLPPLELRHLKRGHGVHFTIPHGTQTYYLDLLGQPPRIGAFATAYRQATVVEWRGLKLRVVDVPGLVLTKKTNRDQDYVAIQRLTELVFRQAKADRRLRPVMMKWLLKELRTPQLLKVVALRWPGGKALATRTRRPAALLAASNASAPAIQAALDEEKARYQQANLDYWKPLLHELRTMRRKMVRARRRSKQK